MAGNAADTENCNVGKVPCKFGKMADRKVVKLSDGELARFKKMMQNSVLSAWAKRAGPEATEEWNKTVGKVLDVEAKP